MLNKSDLLYLCDLNFAESIREIARWTAESEILESNDLLLVAGPDNSTATNFTIRLQRGAHPNARTVLDTCSSFYFERGCDYSLYVRKHADADLAETLQDSSLKLIFDLPVMIIDRPLPLPELPVQAKLLSVTDGQGASDFVAILMDSYRDLGMSPQAGFSTFKTPERIMQPHCYYSIAYYNDQPASGAMLLYSHAIAGIYWVGTTKEARGRGLAAACVSAVVNEAMNRGISHVVLQASKFGEPVYRRLGFREITRYLWYMHFRKKRQLPPSSPTQ
jgi:ribosomal protein S18 acetylase RimI-like enzyme